MEAVSWPGFPPQSRIIPAVIVAMLLALRLRLEAIAMVGAWGTALLASLVKALMKRPRPVAGVDVRVIAAPLGGSSFPSGHTITYVGVYGFLAYLAYTLLRPAWLRRVVVGALLSLVALVGPSRVHQGHHWLTDVSASYLLGISYLLGLSRLYRGLQGAQHARARMTESEAIPTATTPAQGAARRILVIWNPSAGLPTALQPGGSASAARDILERHGIVAEVVEPSDEVEARAIVRHAVADGVDIVVAAGGDGTVHLVAEGLLGHRHGARDPAAGPGHEHRPCARHRARHRPRRPRSWHRASSGRWTPVRRSPPTGGSSPFLEAGSVGLNAAIFREVDARRRGRCGLDPPDDRGRPPLSAGADDDRARRSDRRRRVR